MRKSISVFTVFVFCLLPLLARAQSLESLCRQYMERRATQEQLMAFDTLIEEGCLARVSEQLQGLSPEGSKNSASKPEEAKRLLNAAWLNEIRSSEDEELKDALEKLRYGGYLQELAPLILASKDTKASGLQEVADHLLECMDMSNYGSSEEEGIQWQGDSQEKPARFDSMAEKARARYGELRNLSAEEEARVKRWGKKGKGHVIEVDAHTDNAFGLGFAQWQQKSMLFFFDENQEMSHHEKP
mgnify:CR=1 FL=1